MRSHEFYTKMATMPELTHNPENRKGDEFDPSKSEVLAWIAENITAVGLANQLWFTLRNSGVMVFDKATGKYHGRTQAEYEAEKAAKAEAKAVWAAGAEDRKRAKWRRKYAKQAAAKAAERGAEWKPKRRGKTVPEYIIAELLIAYAMTHNQAPTVEELKLAGMDAKLMDDAGCSKTMSAGTFYRRLKWARVKDTLPVVERPGVRDGKPVIELWRDGMERFVTQGNTLPGNRAQGEPATGSAETKPSCQPMPHMNTPASDSGTGSVAAPEAAAETTATGSVPETL